ncbi:MAG TPA: hypothetical protein PLV52_01710 [Candidatus Omnitrophota bacterium]|nr:hypothetical protein [Candidatus Omnitrophota bacterium]
MPAKKNKTTKSKAKAGAKNPKTPVKAPEKPETTGARSNGPSRNELMLEAKARGIKNFRVLNKQELAEILKDGTTQERANEIVAGAVARWKNGWGAGKRKEKSQT